MSQRATGRNIKFVSSQEAARIAVRSQHLTPQQTRAIDLLLRGMTDLQVAAEIGVNRGTIYRWRRSSFFAEVLGKLRMQVWEQSAQQMQALTEPALELMRTLLGGEDRNLALRAAGMVLRAALSIHAKSSRLGKPVQPPQDKDTWDEFDAYINAPMPLPGMAETLMKQQQNRT
jgi:hypothetical protein